MLLYNCNKYIINDKMRKYNLFIPLCEIIFRNLKYIYKL